jgi:hypothetical protein
MVKVVVELSDVFLPRACVPLVGFRRERCEGKYLGFPERHAHKTVCGAKRNECVNKRVGGVALSCVTRPLIGLVEDEGCARK